MIVSQLTGLRVDLPKPLLRGGSVDVMPQGEVCRTARPDCDTGHRLALGALEASGSTTGMLTVEGGGGHDETA